MISRTLLAAGAVALLAAPALAQHTTHQTPSSPSSSSSASAPQSPTASSGTLQIQPGSTVTGSDGQALGQLEGVRTNAAGQQELTVRGSDGQLRAVPTAGLRQEGSGLVVGWSSSDYQAAPAIAEPPTAASSTGEPGTPPSTEPDASGTDAEDEPQG